jgi:hypothetical protein
VINLVSFLAYAVVDTYELTMFAASSYRRLSLVEMVPQMCFMRGGRGQVFIRTLASAAADHAVNSQIDQIGSGQDKWADSKGILRKLVSLSSLKAYFRHQNAASKLHDFPDHGNDPPRSICPHPW